MNANVQVMILDSGELDIKSLCDALPADSVLSCEMTILRIWKIKILQ